MGRKHSETWVLRITGTKAVLGGKVDQWQVFGWVQWYDPDARNPGRVGWVTDPSKAKRYPSEGAALSDYHRISAHKPAHKDGSHNKPLYDRHTVEVVRLDHAMGMGEV